MACFGLAGEPTITLFWTLKHNLLTGCCALLKQLELAGLDVSRNLCRGEEMVGIFDFHSACIWGGLANLLLDAVPPNFHFASGVAAAFGVPGNEVNAATDLLLGRLSWEVWMVPRIWSCCLSDSFGKVAMEALLLVCTGMWRTTGDKDILRALLRGFVGSTPEALHVERMFSLSCTGRAIAVLLLRGPEGGKRFVILPKGGRCLMGASGGLENLAASLVAFFSSASWFSRSLTCHH